MILNWLALVAALILSAIAAYFSVLGMTAIFSGSFWPVVVMVGALEITKVICACWLKFFWHEIGKFLRVYLSVCVIILVLITSLGVFGFLSKAHLDQQVRFETGVGEKIKLVDLQISNEEKNITDLDFQLKALDTPISKLLDTSKKNWEARRALKEIKSQKKDRKAIQDDKLVHLKSIADLKTERIKLKSEMARQEAEVGPIKYVAALIYGEPSQTQLDTAVRWLIILLVSILDPLAIALLLGANVHFQKRTVRIRSVEKILGDYQ